MRKPSREELARAGRRVIAWRHDHDKTTQRELAHRAGISVGAIQSLESGARTTTRASLEKLAAAMATTIEALLAPEAGLAGPIDPLLASLMPEDLQVAFMYSRATAGMKIQILEALENHLRGQREILARGEALSAFAPGKTFPETRSADRLAAAGGDIAPPVTKKTNHA